MAADDDKELRALAGRVRAAGIPPPEGDCPDEDTLRAWRESRLDEAATAAVDRHLARCAPCVVALRGLRPTGEAERERLARAAQEAAGPTRAESAGGLWARLAEWLSGWPGRATLAGAAAAVLLVVVVRPVGPPEGGAPRYGIERVTVSAERGAEEPVLEALVKVGRPDAVVRARFAPIAGGPIDAAGLGARAVVRPPRGTALRPLRPLRLAFEAGGGLELAFQAGATFGDGPGTYVLWVLIGPAESLPEAAALAAAPLAAAEDELLAGAEAGRWTLKRLELRYEP